MISRRNATRTPRWRRSAAPLPAAGPAPPSEPSWPGAWDRRLFAAIAGRHWPLAEGVLPKLSRAADHGVLWFCVGGALAATGSRPARRAAVRGVASLAVASATVNTVAKRSVRRDRPLLDAVPVIRRLHRQPFTTSFPSGHAASAAAFATGAALESRRWGLLIAPVAWSVAFSRIYTGVHYPGDVAAGLALGAGAAFAVRGLVPTRAQLAPPARPRADAPALPGGRGLVVVVNGGAGNGSADVVRQARERLPEAEFVDADGELAAALDDAAARAARAGGALGVAGGDGTVNTAARAALAHGVPLAVLPGGTRNHFAYDLGIETAADTCGAVCRGEAVAVDVGRFAPGADGRPGLFLNTFSLGPYPDLVRVRERWAPRVGSWPAGVAAADVLRSARPVRLGIGGARRSVWVLFAGNCTYRGMGATPIRRFDLADGLLDVRVLHGGRLPAARLLAAALTGPLRGSPVHAAARLRRLRIDGVPAGEALAYDGEVAPAPPELTLSKANEALTAYRPLPS